MEDILMTSVYFFLLLIVSATIKYFFKKKERLSTLAGSIIMAIGIFALAAFPELPFYTKTIAKLITIELFIIWLFIAATFIDDDMKHIPILTKPIMEQFGIGTWVAGSAMLTLLCLTELSHWHVVILMLTTLTFATWIGYVVLIASKISCPFCKTHEPITGTILLSTVSTQSIVLLINALFPSSPLFILQILILIGYLFYALGLIKILHHCLTNPPQPFFIRFSNTNSIIHGALSISGLASIESHAINYHIIICTWLLATICFVLIESMSLIKLFYRIKFFGLKNGINAYHISQWSRNFTFGMYYAFTLSFKNHYSVSNAIVRFIVHYGQYVVFIFISIEIVIFLLSRLTNSDELKPL